MFYIRLMSINGRHHRWLNFNADSDNQPTEFADASAIPDREEAQKWADEFNFINDYHIAVVTKR